MAMILLPQVIRPQAGQATESLTFLVHRKPIPPQNAVGLSPVPIHVQNIKFPSRTDESRRQACCPGTNLTSSDPLCPYQP